MIVLKWLALITEVAIWIPVILLLGILIVIFYIGQCIGEWVNARLHS